MEAGIGFTILLVGLPVCAGIILGFLIQSMLLEECRLFPARWGFYILTVLAAAGSVYTYAAVLTEEARETSLGVLGLCFLECLFLGSSAAVAAYFVLHAD